MLELLIPPPPLTKNGRTQRLRVDDRAALKGIRFVIEHGIARKKRPVELGFGSGITCWRRLPVRQKAGVCEELHHAALEQLDQDGALDWSRAYWG